MTKISITFRNLTYLTIVERTMGVKGARLVYKAEWKQLTKVIFNNNPLLIFIIGGIPYLH